MKKIISVAALVLVGCSSQSGHMQVSTSQSYASLSAQREAIRTVSIVDTSAGYEVLGPVDASRCHRNTLEAAPSDELVLTDLKVAAYARGADAITGITTIKESGLLKNCWHIITIKGTMLRKTG